MSMDFYDARFEPGADDGDDSEPKTFTVDLNGELRPCPACHEPMVMLNGVPTKPFTVWGSPERPFFTAHTKDCQYRGKALPEEVFW